MKRTLILAVLAVALAPFARADTVRGAHVDADMQQVLDAAKASAAKPFHTLTPEEAREQPTFKDAVAAVLEKRHQEAPKAKLKSVTDREIPGAKDPLQVRIYTPEGAGLRPGVVYFHGGGFVLANLDVYDEGPRQIARQSGAVVVSVHYRLAPEHALPAAHDDASAAFEWVRQHAAELGIDAKKIAVAGESAGGNLATFVARTHKDQVVHQLLIYPFVSTDMSTPSHKRNGTGDYLVSNEDLAWFWKYALGEGNHGDEKTMPSLVGTESLEGSPSATVIVASLDPLLDEGIAYAKKLQAAGVKVELKEYTGVTHEFFGMDAVVAKARTAQLDAARALKRAFAAGPTKR